MTNSLPWLTATDREILEFLGENDVVFSPKSLFLSLERDASEDVATPSYSQIARRTRFLTDEAGFLARIETGKYALADLGRRWLDDELSEGEWRELEKIERAG